MLNTANQATLRALLAHSADLMVVIDSEGRRTFVAPSVESVTGRTAQELVGKDVFSYVHPEDAPRVRAVLEEYRPRGGSVIPPVQLRYRHADGHWIWLEVVARNLMNHPDVGGILIHGREITAQKEAQQQLELERRRYRALAEHSADIIRVLDAQGVQHFVSPSVEPVLGSRPEQVVGSAFAALVHPDDRDMVVEQLGAVLDSAPPHPPVTLEYRVRHASGAWHTMEASLSDLRDNAAVGGLVLASRDITRRKLAEDKIVQIEGELQNTMMTDPTTGIANRRAFLSFGDHHIRIARRLRNPTGLIQVRIGNLAEINQAQGLEAGDRTLRGCAEILRKTFRDTDVIARIGGATFAVLAMVRTPHDLSVACDRLIQRVVLWNAEHPSLEMRVALGGAATSHQPKRTLSELMHEATQRMGPSDDAFLR